MGWNLNDLPMRHQQAIREQIFGSPFRPPQDVGCDGTTTPAAESDLHDKVEEYCRTRGWYYIHSRMDRKTTTRIGAPDFVIALATGRTLWLELKRRGGKPTTPQLAALAQLNHLGHTTLVSDNWHEVKAMLDCCPHG